MVITIIINPEHNHVHCWFSFELGHVCGFCHHISCRSFVSSSSARPHLEQLVILRARDKCYIYDGVHHES